MAHAKIGLMGLAGSGKDALCDAFVKAIGQEHSIGRTRYAAPLKYAARKVFGQRFDDRDYKEREVPFDQDRAVDAAFDMCRLLGFSEEQMSKASALYFEQTDFMLPELSPRKFQQLLGTEVVRKIDPDAFVRYLRGSSFNITMLVPDVRFKNELFDPTLLVIRPSVVREVTQNGVAHESERFAYQLTEHAVQTNGEPFSYSGNMIIPVYNDGDLAQLEKKSRLIWDYLIKQQFV